MYHWQYMYRIFQNECSKLIDEYFYSPYLDTYNSDQRIEILQQLFLINSRIC